MNLSGAVRVEEVEGGDSAGVAGPVLEAARHVGVAVELGDLDGPGPTEGDGGVHEDVDLRLVPGMEVQLDVLARVVPAESGDCRVTSSEDLEMICGAPSACKLS